MPRNRIPARPLSPSIIASLRRTPLPPREEEPRKGPSGPVTAEGVRVQQHETYDAQRSIDLTHRTLIATLAIECPEGHAPRGVHCYSGTRGLCRERYALGREHAVTHPPVPVGELHSLATAQRRATRDAAFRAGRVR